MNKTELVAAIAANAELSKKDAEKALKAFTDIVTEELKQGGKVQLVGFGTFEVSERPAREGINPKTQEKIKRAAQVIRNKYDNYIDEANNVLTKLGFDPIKKRNDYMRHFQELNDVFSKHGIPFNAKNMADNVSFLISFLFIMKFLSVKIKHLHTTSLKFRYDFKK